jgi:hypothetical protein
VHSGSAILDSVIELRRMTAASWPTTTCRRRASRVLPVIRSSKDQCVVLLRTDGDQPKS